ncbi:MAG TPA: FMN-binding negative transcriptional regulator [Dongiaceae bacterium]|jgi:transcriptional regulator|nr:FMN-binding negative transcriptional regulator [Dongiaceae bacterium]
MYVPPHFVEDDKAALHRAIRETRLATLVTLGSEGLEASHVPILLDEGEGPFGVIRGHVARANPQWRRAATETPALAIFLGPDAYVSPNWYATKRETGKVVPTWNYLAIHAYGRVEFFEDAERLRAIVTSLTQRHEGRREKPWAVSDAPEDYIQAQLRGIIGFRLPIDRLEGKWKLSQNRPEVDRRGVIEGLEGEGGALESAIAQRMKDGL